MYKLITWIRNHNPFITITLSGRFPFFFIPVLRCVIDDRRCTIQFFFLSLWPNWTLHNSQPGAKCTFCVVIERIGRMPWHAQHVKSTKQWEFIALDRRRTQQGTQQWRPEPPAVTLTWHASNQMVCELHQSSSMLTSDSSIQTDSARPLGSSFILSINVGVI